MSELTVRKTVRINCFSVSTPDAKRAAIADMKNDDTITTSTIYCIVNPKSLSTVLPPIDLLTIANDKFYSY